MLTAKTVSLEGRVPAADFVSFRRPGSGLKSMAVICSQAARVAPAKPVLIAKPQPPEAPFSVQTFPISP